MKNCQPVEIGVVKKAAEKVTEIIPNSKKYLLDNINKLGGREWQLCQFPPDIIERVLLEQAHTHGARKNLVGTYGPIKEAKERYSDENFKNEAPECHDRIEQLRLAIKLNQDINPTFLKKDTERNKIIHIDGLHRMVAWLLEEKTDPMWGYIAC